MQPETLIRVGFATGTTVALLVLYHLLQRVVSPKHTVSVDMRGKNTAYQLVQSCHVLAVLLLVPGIVQEALTHKSVTGGALWATAFAALGLALIQFAGWIGIQLLLRSSLENELQRGNAAAGVAAGANYIAIGILASRTIAGSDLRGLGLSVAFFCIAVASLALFVALFRALTVYDDAEQIQGENLAAALSYTGITIAVAIVLTRALKGDFESWKTSLLGYGLVAAGALALYPVRQLFVQGLILGRRPTLRGGALDQSIGVERNLGMATMEALAYVATAIAIAELS